MSLHFQNLSPEVAARVDARCGYFETKLLTGQNPQIEECLGGFVEPERSVLLQELLSMEVEYLLANNPASQRTAYLEYFDRFPKDASLVAGVLNHFFAVPGPVESEIPALPPIPRYEILAKLGAGAMGTVYKAIHLNLKREVAIKVLSEDRMTDEDARLRFKQEMVTVGQLKHPNIVEAYDADYCEGICFLAMEYIDGLDLAQIVRRCGPLRVADACELVRRSALGLQQAHRCQLVHRDIKPSNLMLGRSSQHDENVELKVADLGLARICGAVRLREGRRQSGYVVGTLNYMAPEQFFTPDDADIRADIYSLGCTLHELLLGKPPYTDRKYKTPRKKMEAHRDDPFPPIRQARPDVSKMLEDVIHAMMAKRPEERYETPQELADALALLGGDYDLVTLLEMAQELSAPPDPRTAGALAATEVLAGSPPRPSLRRSQ